MKKYVMKKNVVNIFRNEYNIGNFANKIGITRQTLFGVLAGNRCGYPLAFTITKTVSENLSIENFFEEI